MPVSPVYVNSAFGLSPFPNIICKMDLQQNEVHNIFGANTWLVLLLIAYSWSNLLK
jgi:hypothetical protein